MFSPLLNFSEWTDTEQIRTTVSLKKTSLYRELNLDLSIIKVREQHNNLLVFVVRKSRKGLTEIGMKAKVDLVSWRLIIYRCVLKSKLHETRPCLCRRFNRKLILDKVSYQSFFLNILNFFLISFLSCLEFFYTLHSNEVDVEWIKRSLDKNHVLVITSFRSYSKSFCETLWKFWHCSLCL